MCGLDCVCSSVIVNSCSLHSFCSECVVRQYWRKYPVTHTHTIQQNRVFCALSNSSIIFVRYGKKVRFFPHDYSTKSNYITNVDLEIVWNENENHTDTLESPLPLSLFRFGSPVIIKYLRNVMDYRVALSNAIEFTSGKLRVQLWIELAIRIPHRVHCGKVCVRSQKGFLHAASTSSIKLFWCELMRAARG